MITIKDENVKIKGTQYKMFEEWCLVTHSIFSKLEDDENTKFEKMRRAIEFVIENDNVFKEVKNNENT